LFKSNTPRLVADKRLMDTEQNDDEKGALESHDDGPISFFLGG